MSEALELVVRKFEEALGHEVFPCGIEDPSECFGVLRVIIPNGR